MTLMAAMVKPNYAPPSPNLQVAEVTLEPGCPGRSVAELSATLPPDVKIVAVRQHHLNVPASPDMALQDGDGLLLVGSPVSIERAKVTVGREEPGRLSRDRANYDVVRVYVSKASFIASRCGILRYLIFQS
jgi:putative transport protein